MQQIGKINPSLLVPQASTLSLGNAEENIDTITQRVAEIALNSQHPTTSLQELQILALSDPQARYLLGKAYLKEKKLALALQQFKWAFAKGYVDAGYEAGLCYLHGTGAKVNHEKALEWFQKASNKGCVEAQKQLAKMVKSLS